MDKDEMRKKAKEEEDYVRSPKFGNSLSKFLTKRPNGVDRATIARLLLLTESEVDAIYNESIEILRLKMGNDS